MLAEVTSLNIVDCGDYVVVTNAKDIKVTGKKEEQLVYRKHTMFPGGLKETPYKVMQQKKPEEVRHRVNPFPTCDLPSVHYPIDADHPSRRRWHVAEEQVAGSTS